MIVAVDVHYPKGIATAAGVLFRDWSSGEAELELSESIPIVEPYVPGSFYKRELPCLLKLLGRVVDQFDTVIVDGYVWLGPGESPGLGGHLFRELGKRIPVVGVAKSPFKGSADAQRVWRGRSVRPLYVTAAGVDPFEAARCVEKMHGPYRIPTLLRRVDQLCRSGACPGPDPGFSGVITPMA